MTGFLQRWTPVETTYGGQGISFTAPCMVRRFDPANREERERRSLDERRAAVCSVLAVDNGESGRGDVRNSAPADWFQITVDSGFGTPYNSGPKEIQRGKVEISKKHGKGHREYHP